MLQHVVTTGFPLWLQPELNDKGHSGQGEIILHISLSNLIYCLRTPYIYPRNRRNLSDTFFRVFFSSSIIQVINQGFLNHWWLFFDVIGFSTLLLRGFHWSWLSRCRRTNCFFLHMPRSTSACVSTPCRGCYRLTPSTLHIRECEFISVYAQSGNTISTSYIQSNVYRTRDQVCIPGVAITSSVHLQPKRNPLMT